MLNERTAPVAPPPQHVRALDTALRLLHATGRALVATSATELDLRPAASAVERSIVAALDALDARRDPGAATRDAASAIDEAIAALRAGPAAAPLDPLPAWLDRARGWVLAAEELLAATPFLPIGPGEIAVSDGTPSRFRIERPTLAPSFRVAEPLPPPVPAVPPDEPGPDGAPVDPVGAARARAERVREAARERRLARERRREERRRPEEPEAPPGFVASDLVAIAPGAFVARRAREMFEEITTCGIQRAGQLGDAWRDLESIDRRMLRALDAIAGLGGRAVAALEGLVLDAPAADPSRGFALAFALGAFEGRDTLAAIDRVTRWLGPADPEVQRAVAGALQLVPHPDLAPWMRGWLTDDEASLRAIAVDVLGYRRLATEDDLGRALEDRDAAVVARALRWAALGAAPARQLARDAIGAHRDSGDAALIEASAWANAIGGFAAAADEIEALLGTPHEAVALVPLAIAGGLEHVRRLVEHVGRAPSAHGAEALGFAGAGEALPVLAAMIDDPQIAPEARQAAAFALQRITGIEIFDEVDVPPESLDAAEPADPPNVPADRRSLARQVSDPRDRPADGAPDRMRLPTTRPLVWDDVLAREGHRFPSGRRHRRGHLYTPAQALLELDRCALTPRERRVLHAELVVGTGEDVPFDPHDFVPVQEAAIAAWGPIAQRASTTPGGWAHATRR